MKKVLFFTLLFPIFSAFSQRTVQFSDPLPTGSSSVGTTDKQHFGDYKNTESGVVYHIDENGLSIISVVIAYVTREQVRESSKLRVSGNYLHGIVAGDSVPCALEGENYYYGITQRLPITGIGTTNSLTRLTANTYLINFHEGMYFEPSLVEFTNGKMTIIHGELAYQDAFNSILQVNTITRYGAEVVILAPSFEQWERLRTLLFVGDKLTYVKQ